MQGHKASQKKKKKIKNPIPYMFIIPVFKMFCSNLILLIKIVKVLTYT